MAFIKDETILDGATSTGAGTPENIAHQKRHTFHIVATSVSTGATVDIEASLDGTNWSQISSNSISSNGTTEFTTEAKYKMVRANISSYTDGTYTVRYFGE